MSINQIVEPIEGEQETTGEVSKTQDTVSHAVSQLVDSRTISKTHNQQGRNKLSQDIKKFRGWRDEGRDNLNAANRELQDIQRKVRELEEEKKKFQGSVVGKISETMSRYGIRTNKKIIEFNQEITLLNNRAEAYTEEKQRSQRRISVYAELPKEELAKFQEKTFDTPLSIDEKKQLLKPEVLSSLSLEEYIKLWRRLNPYFLGHVTRQGFRDHNAMSAHSGGLEEFHEGFTSVLDDSKLLRPPISVHHGLNPYNTDSIKKFIELEILPNFSNVEEAKNGLGRILWHSFAAAPKYAADTSLHLAKEIIADATYGGERGNEVFYIFPSDVMASQYNYSFNWTSDFREKQHEEKWNDVFVWPSDTQTNAIPLDIGIVFLPGNSQVDVNTGSKYTYKEVNGEKVMIENEEVKHQLMVILDDISGKGIGEDEFENEFLIQMNTGGFELPEKLGLSIYQNISSYLYSTDTENLGRRNELILNILKDLGLLWEFSKNTVNSYEYWEEYFKRNPDKKPKHIVYYRGDPTEVVHNFLVENNIKERGYKFDKDQDPLIGLGENNVENMKDDERAKPAYDILIETAHTMIDEHYTS